MWNPTPYSTLALFVCSDPTVKLGHFRLEKYRNMKLHNIKSWVTQLPVSGNPLWRSSWVMRKARDLVRKWENKEKREQERERERERPSLPAP